MSDRELEAIKAKKLHELQKRIALREQKIEQTDGNDILKRIFKGRAWEVFNAAKSQFPAAMTGMQSLLVNIALEGKITEITGEQLNALFREIGLRVKLNTTIKVASHGKRKLLSEKIKESIK
jgi:DNA-binding TFAR19-related protein (PDSD5 family)